jgi:hypothetical protein
MTPLEKYEKACNDLKDEFLADLCNDGYYATDGYWVSNQVGGVYSWGDWCVDMGDVADYYRYGFTPQEFFEWYDETMDSAMKGKHMNMKTWKKLSLTEST